MERYSDREAAAEKDSEAVEESSGAVITAEPGPLQMTSFTKSYFTRSYKGHTPFRALVACRDGDGTLGSDSPTSQKMATC